MTMLTLRTEPDTCLWCGATISYTPLTVHSDIPSSEHVRVVNAHKAQTYRAHMMDNHPAVLDVLGS